METKDVFISYRATEANEAFWVKSVLEMYGISCWIAPNCISGGSDYAHEIPSAINACKIFVLMLSKKAQNSQWVRKELSTAINYEKIIMPFMIESFELNKEFNFFLSNVQRYEAYANKTQMIYNMVNEINRILGREAITPPENTVPEAKAQNSKPKKTNPVISGLKKITPYGRKYADDPKVRFPLHITSVLTGITFIPLLFAGMSMKGNTVFNIILLLVGFLCWYMSYLACIGIGKLGKSNKFFAAISAYAVYNVIIFTIVSVAIPILRTFVW